LIFGLPHFAEGDTPYAVRILEMEAHRLTRLSRIPALDGSIDLLMIVQGLFADVRQRYCVRQNLGQPVR